MAPFYLIQHAILNTWLCYIHNAKIFLSLNDAHPFIKHQRANKKADSMTFVLPIWITLFYWFLALRTPSPRYWLQTAAFKVGVLRLASLLKLFINLASISWYVSMNFQAAWVRNGERWKQARLIPCVPQYLTWRYRYIYCVGFPGLPSGW